MRSRVTPDPELLSRINTALSDWYLPHRAKIVRQVQAHRFIRTIADGDAEALEVCLTAYWPYIGYFAVEIASRLPIHGSLIWDQLSSRVPLSRIAAHQAGIRTAEGSHAELWRALAASAGVALPIDQEPVTSPAMARLIRTMAGAGNPAFYAGLAAIEASAWAFSELVAQGALARRQGLDLRWFDVHLTDHQPTHEQMYAYIGFELCRAPGTDPRRLFENYAEQVVALFTDVADELVRELRLAPA